MRDKGLGIFVLRKTKFFTASWMISEAVSYCCKSVWYTHRTVVSQQITSSLRFFFKLVYVSLCWWISLLQTIQSTCACSCLLQTRWLPQIWWGEGGNIYIYIYIRTHTCVYICMYEVFDGKWYKLLKSAAHCTFPNLLLCLLIPNIWGESCNTFPEWVSAKWQGLNNHLSATKSPRFWVFSSLNWILILAL